VHFKPESIREVILPTADKPLSLVIPSEAAEGVFICHPERSREAA
jgi:hypothetical protein